MSFPPRGLILAGGLARRMGGGDKGLVALAGAPLIARVISRARTQCVGLALNANGDPARFAALGLTVVPDTVGDHPGPLAGILAGLDHLAAQGHADSTAMLSLPADTPFIPRDLAARLAAAGVGDKAISCAASGGRVHHTVALWPLGLRHDLRACIVGGMRKVADFTARHPSTPVDFEVQPVDPFFNVNTPGDLARADAILRGQTPAQDLDLRGLKCPLPVLRARKALLAMAPGDVLALACTDPVSAIDIPHLVAERGDILQGQERRGDAIHFRIERA